MDFYTVDAFTSRPFAGNPAAVVPLYNDLTDRQMQDIAVEMNLSETAYVVPEGTTADKESFRTASRFHLRWFTPEAEIFFCGHATLATSHTLFHEIGNTSSCLEFRTLAGDLKVRRDGENIIMDFPTYPAEAPPADLMTSVQELAASAGGGKAVVEVRLERSNCYLLVQLEDMTRSEFENLIPDMGAINKYRDTDVKGVIITTRGSLGPEDTRGYGDYDFVSRFLCPWSSVPEDPVTGSAHTLLAPFWSEKLAKTHMKCRQASKRGGDLIVTLHGDRVHLEAQAVTVLRGKIVAIQ